MKKFISFKIIMLVVISLFTTNLFSQGAYVSLNLGYGLGASSQNIGIYNRTSTNYEQVNVSFGQGLNIGGTFGYMLNENIGAELGISYLLGGSSTMQHSFTSGTTDYTFSSKMLRINPSIVLTTGLEGINPYAKFGFLIGTGSITNEVNQTSGGTVAFIKTKLNGGMALGFTASIGAMYNLSDNMSLFGEFAMVNMSYAPTKGEVTEATLNGADKLSDLTTKEKLTDYVDSFNPSTSIPDSQPDQLLKEKLPFGSFGINIGIRIGF